MPDLISPDFIFGVIAGIILSSVIPIKIQFGREADKEYDSRLKAKSPEGKIQTEPPHGMYTPDKPS